jgi:hypothetical protein
MEAPVVQRAVEKVRPLAEPWSGDFFVAAVS